jgi:hypothetical protein
MNQYTRSSPDKELDMRRAPSRYDRLAIGAVSIALAVSLGALVANASTGTAPPTRSTVTVTFGDKGSTVRLQVGETLRVLLDNTYWSIGPSSRPRLLAPHGAVRVHPRLTGCVPGEGCGSVTALFRALEPGTAVISASRVSCGEALRCTGGNGSFDVTVRIQ